MLTDHRDTSGTGELTGDQEAFFLVLGEGCLGNCAYCAIPLIRGPHEPWPPELVMGDARREAARGVKELVLSYSHELVQRTADYVLPLKGLPEVAELDVSVSGVTGEGTRGVGQQRVRRLDAREVRQLYLPA